MRNKIRLALGWFGVLTPVYAAGVMTVLLAVGEVDLTLIGRVIFVCVVNFFVGRFILRAKVAEKGAKKRCQKI